MFFSSETWVFDPVAPEALGLNFETLALRKSVKRRVERRFSHLDTTPGTVIPTYFQKATRSRRAGGRAVAACEHLAHSGYCCSFGRGPVTSERMEISVSDRLRPDPFLILSNFRPLHFHRGTATRAGKTELSSPGRLPGTAEVGISVTAVERQEVPL